MIERIDAISREICRYMADGNRMGVVSEFVKAKNPIEAGLIAIMAADRMADETRRSFITFLTNQAGVL